MRNTYANMHRVAMLAVVWGGIIGSIIPYEASAQAQSAEYDVDHPNPSLGNSANRGDRPYREIPEVFSIGANTADVEISSLNWGRAYVAINPVRPCEVFAAAHALYQDFPRKETYYFFRSTTSGASWNTITTTRTDALWDVAIDRNERYYVLEGHSFFGTRDLSLGYSTDHGSSWSYVTLPTTSGEHDQPVAMAVDNSRVSPYEGSVYVATSGGREIMRSTTSGATWPSSWTTIPIPTAVTDYYGGLPFACENVDIQTGPDGQVYICYTTFGSTNPIGGGTYSFLVFAKSTDAGATWTSDALFNGHRDDWLPISVMARIAVNQQNNNIFILRPVTEDNDHDLENSELAVMRSTDGGDSWSTSFIPDPSLEKDQSRGVIACDPISGAVAVGYLENEQVVGSPAPVYESRVAISYDQGDTWGSMTVSDDTWLAPDHYREAGWERPAAEIDVHYGNVVPLWTMDLRDTSGMRGPLYTSSFEMECPENLWLGKATINDNALYSVSNTITVEPPAGSQYLIPATNPGQVLMYAGTKIKLLPGFCAKEGSRYKARIQPCGVFSDVDEFALPICQESRISSAGSRGHESSTGSYGERCLSYPNPFNGMTNIRYDVGVAGPVSITVYDVAGNEVGRLLEGETQSEGVHLIRFDGSSLAPGAYHVLVRTASYTRSMLLTRTQ